MAHVAKYARSALPAMLRHYDRTPEREGFERPNIDPSRTPLNYDLCERHHADQYGWVAERVGSLRLKRRPRENAVFMCDCAFTLPVEVRPGDERKCFEAAYAALRDLVGSENVISCYVHMDELNKDGTLARPHMHFAFVPVTPDGRLSAKDVVNRAFLKKLHPTLDTAVEQALGYPTSVLLDDEDKAAKARSRLSHDEYADVKAQLDDARAQLVAVRQDAEDARRSAVEAAERVGRLDAEEKSMNGRIAALRASETVVEASLADARTSLSVARKDAEKARKDAEKAAERVGRLDAEEKSMNGRIAALRASETAAEASLRERERELREIEESVDAERAARDADRARFREEQRVRVGERTFSLREVAEAALKALFDSRVVVPVSSYGKALVRRADEVVEALQDVLSPETKPSSRRLADDGSEWPDDPSAGAQAYYDL